MSFVKVTSKGRVTLPPKIQQHLKLRIGDKIGFTIDQYGQIILTAMPKKKSLRTTHQH